MTLVNTTLLSAFRVLSGQCLASKTLVMIPKGDPRTPMVTSRLTEGTPFHDECVCLDTAWPCGNTKVRSSSEKLVDRQS